MTLHVLFLDDDAGRTHRFLHRVPTAITVETAEACIERLRAGTGDPSRPTWDAIFLDHDLGGEIYVQSERTDTGMEVVRWMEAHLPPIQKVIVHTHNDSAGVEMERRLAAVGYHVGYHPFGWFDPLELLEAGNGSSGIGAS